MIKVFPGNSPKSKTLDYRKQKVFSGEAWGLPSVPSIHKFSNYRSAVVF